MRRVLVAIGLLLWSGCAAQASTCGNVPWTFVNGTVADANQVNSNFASIFNCANNLLATITSVAAQAQQVLTNSDLVAASTSNYPRGVWRKCFSTSVCADPLFYVAQTGSCATNSRANDGGDCVDSASGGSWMARWPAHGMDARQFGVVGTGLADDGPPLRSACTAGAINGLPIVLPVPTVGYLITTLDSSGNGGIVIGTGSAGTAAKPCNIKGTQSADYPDSCYSGATPTIKLGPALNRPLVYIHKNTQSPLFENICLDGNRTQQSGWAGGPSGLLFTVQVEDDASPPIDTSLRLDRVVIMGGYDGNIYTGSGRGGCWWRDSWFVYSGQTTSSIAVYWNGYDCTVHNMAIGSNTGVGLLAAEGSQYQITDGAIFFNGGRGVVVNGGAVQYMTMSGTNIQSNGQNGIHVLSHAPVGQAAGPVFSNVTFDGNSASSTGTYSDVLIDDMLTARFVNPVFVGNATGSAPFPKYNVEVSGTGAAVVSNPSFSAGTNNASGFTNNITRISGSNSLQRSWTPSLRGSGTAGTFTATGYSVGEWTWNNSSITAAFSINGTLAGAVGDMQVTLPSSASSITNNTGSCTISKVGGWTAAAGFVTLGGLINSGAAVISLIETASAHTPQTAAVGEFSGTIDLIGSCTYSVINFP